MKNNSNDSHLLINFDTIQAKIEPLFSVQADLVKTISGFNINAVTAPLQSLESSLSTISNIASESNLLLKTPSYDFVKEPLLSTLNSVADSIKINQDRVLSYMPTLEVGASQIGQASLAIPDYINGINSLGTVALDYLKSSPTVFPLYVDSAEAEVDVLKKQVIALELRIEILENENRNSILTNITKDVSEILEKINPEIAEWFRGAMDALISNKNEDLVGHVAESLTRVIERLPFSLLPNFNSKSSKKKEKMVETLSAYLMIPSKKINNNHLILQQKSYYDILGNIRHRESDAYKMYKKDKSLFKAFVAQVEAYIYILITFKRDEN